MLFKSIAKRKTVIRTAALAAVLSVCLCAFLTAGAAADGAEPYRITVDSYGGRTVAYTVSGGNAGENALAVTAAYTGGRLCRTSLDAFVTGESAHHGTAAIAEDFDDFRIFLLDAETLLPLCRYAGLFTVRFMGADGELLSEQRVPSGQSAVPPQPPEKDGCLFARWDGDFADITADCVITAQYVESDAPNIFTVSSVSGTAGESVTVTVGLTGSVLIGGFDFRLYYDGEALEFDEMDSELSMDVIATHVISGRNGSNYITFNYSGTSNRTSGGSILEAVFNIRDGAKPASPLRLVPNTAAKSVIYLDGTEKLDAEYTACEGVVYTQ